MTFLEILYSLFLRPLELLFDLVFSLVNRSVSNPGVSIFFLSLFVNLLVLPLYRRADAIQSEQRDKEEKLKYWVSHIKKSFKGDERFMMLQTYYRQNNYKPYHILKSSISLLLEIPFFITAYNYLSGLLLLNNVSFGPITDLGAPDSLLHTAGFTINLLPIIMTIINIISATIYLQGFPLKQKIQMYGMAGIFLVVLYNSPSGLVFYWIINNIFSLVKNILNKSKTPKKTLSIILFFIGITVQECVLLFQPFSSIRKNLFIASVCLALQAPFIFRNVNISIRKRNLHEASKTDNFIFLFSCVFMAILTGSLISSSVIKSSPSEFVNFRSYYSPLWYILNSFLLASGTFVFWMGIFYKLASRAGRRIMSIAIWVISVCAVINYLFFGKNRGDISTMLKYDNNPIDTMNDYLVNIAVLSLVSLLLYYFWKKKEKIVSAAVLSLCIAASIMTIKNLFDINTDLEKTRKTTIAANNEIPTIPISRNGKNVIILMLDKSIGYYIPFLLAEKPELQQKFDGFTYYPNTLSFATSTNVALPAIYGGYEYTPAEINKRPEKSLVEKQNEALLMMPALFDKAGYEITIFNPTNANYQYPSDLSIYNDYPNIKAYNVRGMFTSKELQKAENDTLKRNFYCFGIYKSSPLILQPSLYSLGFYNEADAIAGKKGDRFTSQTLYGLFNAVGLRKTYIQDYDVLENFPFITNIIDSDKNTFFTMDSITTHEQLLLQMPDYTISSYVDNSEFENDPPVRTSTDGTTIELEYQIRMTHYHANMGTYLVLGKWLDYLRENNVYDNTRIIIVADHGFYQNYRSHLFGDLYLNDVLWFNPVLMVKDFYSTGFVTDGEFMTNADVPTIAMKDLISDPINPATGNPVSNKIKSEPVHEVQYVENWKTNENNGNTFLPSLWFGVHGNDIFNIGSWEYLGKY